MKNERTSKRVSSIAGKVLKRISGYDDRVLSLITVGDLKALAASALTQAPDKKPVRAKRSLPIRKVKARKGKR